MVSLDADRCAHCVKAGGNIKCDVWGPSKEKWTALKQEEFRLAEEWRTTQLTHQRLQHEQQRLFVQLAESQSKLLRLDRQRESFRERAAKMLKHGLASLDALVELEEQSEAIRNGPLSESSSS